MIAPVELHPSFHRGLARTARPIIDSIVEFEAAGAAAPYTSHVDGRPPLDVGRFAGMLGEMVENGLHEAGLEKLCYDPEESKAASTRPEVIWDEDESYSLELIVPKDDGVTLVFNYQAPGSS